jgi:hypothetical protein
MPSTEDEQRRIAHLVVVAIEAPLLLIAMHRVIADIEI